MESPRRRVLVFGWYNHSNTGDELFKLAFQRLFPEFDFTFTDYFKLSELHHTDAVFIGGGSFLFAKPHGENGFLSLLKSKKLYYLGVGIETDIHSEHQELMRGAQLIAPRNQVKIKEVLALNSRVLPIPDLVYALQTKVEASKNKNSILVLPNLEVVPKWNDPHYKHTSFDYFKSEFAQFLDQLITENYQISFGSMCHNKDVSDIGCIIEIVNKLRYRNYNGSYSLPGIFEELIAYIAGFETVITQRYHGIILAELAKVPCVSIVHHDKLKQITNGVSIPYYGLNKEVLRKGVIEANKVGFVETNQDVFRELKEQVSSTI